MIVLLVHIDLLVVLHQLRLLEEIVHILLVVATELTVNNLIEIGLVFLFHLLTIVLHQRCQHFTIEVQIPGVAIVLEVDILLLGLVLIALDLDATCHSQRTIGHLVIASEGFIEIHHRTNSVEAFLVEVLELVEVEFAFQEARRVLPLTDFGLVGSLLLDESDAVDTFVHTDGVLPVVGAGGIFRVVLDAYGLRGTHMAYHDVLLDLAGLVAGLVLGIATFQDTIAGKISTGAARITERHRERTRLIALQRNLRPLLGMHGDIVLRILCRTARLGVYIDTENREVTGLTRPHPVVCLATKLTHRFGQREHQAYVIVVAIGGQEESVALVERLDLHTQGRVLSPHLLLDGILQRVYEIVTTTLFCTLLIAERVDQ